MVIFILNLHSIALNRDIISLTSSVHKIPNTKPMRCVVSDSLWKPCLCHIQVWIMFYIMFIRIELLNALIKFRYVLVGIRVLWSTAKPKTRPLQNWSVIAAVLKLVANAEIFILTLNTNKTVYGIINYIIIENISIVLFLNEKKALFQNTIILSKLKVQLLKGCQ